MGSPYRQSNIWKALALLALLSCCAQCHPAGDSLSLGREGWEATAPGLQELTLPQDIPQCGTDRPDIAIAAPDPKKLKSALKPPPRLLVDPDGNTYPEIKVTVTEKHVTFSPNGPEVFSESQTTTEGQHLLGESTKKETTLATPRNKKLAEYAGFFRGINPSMHPHPPGFPTSNLEPEGEKAQSLKEATVRHLSMLHLSRDHGSAEFRSQKDSVGHSRYARYKKKRVLLSWFCGNSY
ncbi:hypothetical protein MJO28_010481 [Puccinia striiformis f. sp. tritici]|uniref:Uncharacterized protein n=2 Tax=Puccinia striiformis TaxID=27350 RepID=A0A2S4W9F1_9BASI|nr:hypothetical protein Pst134EB_020192 [Puccinia striiformis f. sp. tritici]KAI7944786.1 hypothetical protein MJO28_010481 [Puccinia striiformis f. sp. tritici]POW18395.1 hypothetical protein PSHT_05884 [Puccinia striiformis]